MRSESTILNRAKRLDRVMHWVITLGGMTIIAAVLGILLFIGKEAYPLFRSARSREGARGALAPCAALVVDASGQALTTLDTRLGVRGYAAGRPVPVPAGDVALMTVSSQLVSVSSDSVGADAFVVPADFKKQELRTQ